VSVNFLVQTMTRTKK